MDRKEEGLAYYRLGQAQMALDDPESAQRNFEIFMKISKELNDRDGEARASLALSTAAKKMQSTSEAVSFLEQYLAISRETESLEAQSEAYSSLGKMYSELGQHEVSRGMGKGELWCGQRKRQLTTAPICMRSSRSKTTRRRTRRRDQSCRAGRAQGACWTSPESALERQEGTRGLTASFQCSTATSMRCSSGKIAGSTSTSLNLVERLNTEL